MATLRRCHAPAPWGAHVETMVWERSQAGTPRRRSHRPALTHDAGWDWDGTRILFGEQTVLPNEQERDCDVCELEDDHPRRTHATRTLSLLDIARCQIARKHGKGRSGLDDFEVVRLPRVVPISEEEPGLGDGWIFGEWERLDVKRTYSEVAQGLVDGKGLSRAPGCSRLVPGTVDDDPWECL